VPGLDVAWQQFFGTSNRHEVEDRCVNDRFDYQWRPDDILQTSIVRPSVLWHQKRQALVFFNQILLHHPACLDEATRSALLELYGHHGLPRSVTFADGTPISDSMIEDILSTAIEAAVCFSWQQGDVLMVDNVAVAHARLAYTGTRRIYVALSQFVENQQ
jgi:alpha-ketoglutarate-dependent taurine dioxygenase